MNEPQIMDYIDDIVEHVRKNEFTPSELEEIKSEAEILLKIVSDKIADTR